MRLLLDTHVFIWLDIAHHRLSNAAQEVIRNPENTLHLSLVSVWEMQIKMQLGKLHLITLCQALWQPSSALTAFDFCPFS